VNEDQLLEVIRENFELRPAGIIQAFDLQSLPKQRGGRFYQDTAAYGHFGRPDLDLPWERTDKVETLKEALKAVAAV
jgi:S-adenosylmethionine synthetase